MRTRPVVLCILDGVGWGRRDDGDAVALASTPHLDGLLQTAPWCLLKAHGTAVGMPSDADMGNSEVGHNAMGAGRVFAQGASLVDTALETGSLWASAAWKDAVAAPTLHLLGLLSDGNVHSNVAHVRALVARAAADGVKRLRVHALTDGRDVEGRSALRWVAPLEAELAATGLDYAFATGGGRMAITMDRYEADWAMVARGWRCHVFGEGRRFASASAAIEALYAEDPKVDDQWLPPFVVGDYAGMTDGDAVIFFNFRGDRAIEISRAFEEGDEFTAFDRGNRPEVRYAGMMEYDGDTHVPKRYLVSPPAIDGTVGQQLAAAGRVVYATAETQKFGHVTYFFNGNRSAALPGETWREEPSDVIPFDQAPAMHARQVTDLVVAAVGSGAYDLVRVNLANGDMVGHTGDLAATVAAMEVIDGCVGRIAAAVTAAGGALIVTADHGNADQMFEVDKASGAYATGADGARKPRTSHSLNPVPFALLDASGLWALAVPARDPARWDAPLGTGEAPAGGLAQIGASLLALCDGPIPADYLPPLVRHST